MSIRSTFVRDENLKVSKAYPAAAATANSDAIDLGDTYPALMLGDAQIEIAAPAVPNLADTKTATHTLQDSADGSSFAAVAELQPLVQTGASSAGADAATRRYKAPAGLRRYIRVSTAVASAGGDNTAKSVELSVVF